MTVNQAFCFWGNCLLPTCWICLFVFWFALLLSGDLVNAFHQLSLNEICVSVFAARWLAELTLCSLLLVDYESYCPSPWHKLHGLVNVKTSSLSADILWLPACPAKVSVFLLIWLHVLLVSPLVSQFACHYRSVDRHGIFRWSVCPETPYLIGRLFVSLSLSAFVSVSLSAFIRMFTDCRRSFQCHGQRLFWCHRQCSFWELLLAFISVSMLVFVSVSLSAFVLVSPVRGHDVALSAFISESSSAGFFLVSLIVSVGAGIDCWLDRRARDRKVASPNPGRSGGRIFFSRIKFVCWLLFGVRSTPVLPQWHVNDPGHSAKSAGGR